MKSCNCTWNSTNGLCVETANGLCDNHGDDEGGIAAAILVPLFLEAILIGVVIGLIIWKRIKVAKFLYNLQLPKLRELPQVVLGRWRPTSTTPPEVYVEHTLNNPTYDLEEGVSSNSTAKLAEATEPTEVYEEIPNQADMEGGFDVYDIPGDDIGCDNLVAYATTDVSGKEMFDAYAITDVSLVEAQWSAYAVTDVTENSCTDKRSNSSSSAKGAVGPSQRDGVKTKPGAILPATRQTAPKNGKLVPGKGKSAGTVATAQPNSLKEPVKMKPPISSAKPSLRPSNRKDSRDKIVPAATSDAAADAHRAKNVRVMFRDEDRSRSQTHAGWEDGKNQTPDGSTSTRSSVRGKPKPLPKKKGAHLKDIRERGQSDSGVQEYSKLDTKTQYASLEPHTGNEMDPVDNSSSNFTQESYSHLKR